MCEHSDVIEFYVFSFSLSLSTIAYMNMTMILSEQTYLNAD